MVAVWKRGNFFDHLVRELLVLRSPDHPSLEQRRHEVHPRDLVHSTSARLPTRRESKCRNAAQPHFINQRHPRRLGLDDHHVWVPVLVLLPSNFLEFWETPPPALRVQQDDVVRAIRRRLEDAPRRDRRKVRRLFLRERRVIRLNDVFQFWNVFLVPHLPPLAADDRGLVPGRLLLPLRRPLGHRQRRLDPQKRILLPELRPQRIPRRHDGRELNHLPLVRKDVRALRRQKPAC